MDISRYYLSVIKCLLRGLNIKLELIFIFLMGSVRTSLTHHHGFHLMSLRKIRDRQLLVGNRFMNLPNLLMLIKYTLFFFFSSIYKKYFHNTVMIYNAKNGSNEATESQKEKGPVLMLIFSTVSQKSGD